MQFVRRAVAPALLSGMAALLAGCGGGSGDSAPPDSAWVSTAAYANQCAADNLDAPPEQRTGTRETEQAWLRALLDERYLWRDDLPVLSRTAARYTEVDFATAMDRWLDDHVRPEGATSKRDLFSHRATAAAGETVTTGTGGSWGLSLVRLGDTPRRYAVSMVTPGGPAALAGVQRGDEVMAIDGIEVDTDDVAGRQRVDELTRWEGPPVDLSVAWSLLRAGQSRQVTLTSIVEQAPPVPVVKVLDTGPSQQTKVGYMLFNAFTAPAEKALATAIQTLANQQVKDLVIDLRYNGGGAAYIAAQLGYMVAGQATEGKAFNAARRNPRLARRVREAPMPFYPFYCDVRSGNDCPAGNQPLPSLNLPRVFVLTGDGTCSSSELVINSLRGIDVEVIQVGQTTCGKPYGYKPVNNCGMTTYVIEEQATNAKGFGDYQSGFTPGGSGANHLPGCEVTDDLSQALGDVREARLAAALTFMETGQCPVTTNVWAGSATPRALRDTSAPMDLSPLPSSR